MLSVTMDLLVTKSVDYQMTSNQNQKTESSKAKETVNTHLEKLVMNLKGHQGFQPDYLLNIYLAKLT